MSLLMSLAIFLSLAHAAPYEFSRKEYQCQEPLELNNFQEHLQEGMAYRAIRWDFSVLNPTHTSGLHLVQSSGESVSPNAVLTLSSEPSTGFPISMKALTMEKKWLEAMRGTEALVHLDSAQKTVFWLNESYHLFSIKPEDLDELPETSPHTKILESGAYVFTHEKMGFIIRKDFKYLTLCPSLDSGTVVQTTREIMNEALKFMEDMKISTFYECEPRLLRR